MKKFFTICLAVACLFTMAACANTDPTPEGMQNVALENAGFNLYVPENWIPNSYNISGAKANAEDNAPNVLATVYYPDEVMTVEAYWSNCCLTEYEAVFDHFTLIEDGTDITLGGKDAKKYKFSYTFGDTLYQCMQVITVYDYNVYTVTYTAISTAYDAYAQDVDSIIANFTFN